MKKTLAIIGSILALTSYIAVLLTSLNVLAITGCVFIVLLAIGLTSKAITAIVNRRQNHHHTVTYWRTE